MNTGPWFREMALGARMSVAGGRSGWVRLALIAVGVGLGVAMLLGAASIPSVVAGRDARVSARAEDRIDAVPRGAGTLLIGLADSHFHDLSIRGRLLQPEGDRAPRPPGVDRMPGPGEMVASPALARLLAEPDGAGLRGRWGERVVGTIRPEGLSGPNEYAFYLGSDRLTEKTATRLRSFGRVDPDAGIPPVLLLLGVVGLVVLLLPVAVFVATAVRFGGEARDRRLAALRLVGADAAMTRRIAAGETLTGALLGLVAGTLLYAVTRTVALRLGVDVHPADLRPAPALAVLVVLLVPAAAIMVTQSAMRQIVVEPLGVVRLAGEQRRQLLWRLILPAGGLALLFPLRDGLNEDQVGDGFAYQVVAGVAALLTGVALLLPWLVEATVRRLGGGGIAWQLAVRRLQLDSGVAVRAVSGIAVSVAGAIALQGLLAAVQTQFATHTGSTTGQFQATVLPHDPAQNGRWVTTLAGTPGVRAATTVTSYRLGDPESTTRLKVGDCAVLRQLAKIGDCADGDAYVVNGSIAPGTPLVLGPGTWTLPAGSRPAGELKTGELEIGSTVLATPKALGGAHADPLAVDVYVALDGADADALEHLRNTAARLDPSAAVDLIGGRSVVDTLQTIRHGLLAGATALLVVIGASMLVNVGEQLRERRRLLAVLVAFGTRRATLTGSVLFQVAIPVLLGLGLAIVAGTALAALLQGAAHASIHFDWSGIAVTSGAAALVVLATTAASLPLLWRLTRPGGLRSE